MQLSSYSSGTAHDDINNLINNDDIKYVDRKVGCCFKKYLKFEEDDHFYIYNPNKTISNILMNKVFTYLYIDMNKNLDKK